MPMKERKTNDHPTKKTLAKVTLKPQNDASQLYSSLRTVVERANIHIMHPSSKRRFYFSNNTTRKIHERKKNNNWNRQTNMHAHTYLHIYPYTHTHAYDVLSSWNHYPQQQHRQHDYFDTNNDFEWIWTEWCEWFVYSCEKKNNFISRVFVYFQRLNSNDFEWIVTASNDFPLKMFNRHAFKCCLVAMHWECRNRNHVLLNAWRALFKC